MWLQAKLRLVAVHFVKSVEQYVTAHMEQINSINRWVVLLWLVSSVLEGQVAWASRRMMPLPSACLPACHAKAGKCCSARALPLTCAAAATPLSCSLQMHC